ncbi:ATP-binding protein [Myxococcus stipitatus]|uniref:McrB family protein n=1 Tax=Myxococcus stipitatus TaxID=83455 RepID=UPI0031452DDB
MLTDAQVQELWEKAQPFPGWEQWQKNYCNLLMLIRGLSDAELARPENQELLWSANAITPLGPGGSVKVSGAFTDPEVVDAIVTLRHALWPTEVVERAVVMSEEGERILGLVSPRHGPRRPQARLWRLFAALLPSDFHCVFNYQAQQNITDLLLPKGTAHNHILIRDRLRKALGPEQDLVDHVRRSVFCWWLHERYEAIKSGQLDVAQPNPVPVERGNPIALWPYGKQVKANAAPKRLIEAYRDVVQATLPGISRSDLVEDLGDMEEFKALSLSSRRSLVSRVTGLGLVEERDKLLRPTQDGHELLERDVPDVLVHRMLERVFPLASILRFVKAEPRTRGQLISYHQELYPAWTGEMAPSSNLAWLRALDLFDREKDGRYRLSEYGAAWEARLPQKLPTRPPEVALSDTLFEELEAGHAEEGASASDAPLARPWPGLSTLRQRFQEDAETRSFVLDSSQLTALHHAWHCTPQKRFVILAGLSGTGKTALIRHYARVYCAALDLDVEKHLEVVAVSPDWKDPTGLLGYYNALHETPTFQVEPTLRLLLSAAQNPSKPYFLLLDEMNLARVEQYFAPFLSSMESGLPIALHGQDAPVNGVPHRLPWPRNLFIAGTVNMDETTFPFSDKVLDRAFTLEFWDVNLRAFFEARQAERQPELERTIESLHQALRPIRRHFGYRTAGELLAFVEAAGTEALPEERIRLLDQGIFSKVLPRLRGESSPELRTAFTVLKKLCEAESLKRCGEKLSQMEANNPRTGVIRFWS